MLYGLTLSSYMVFVIEDLHGFFGKAGLSVKRARRVPRA